MGIARHDQPTWPLADESPPALRTDIRQLIGDSPAAVTPAPRRAIGLSIALAAGVVGLVAGLWFQPWLRWLDGDSVSRALLLGSLAAWTGGAAALTWLAVNEADPRVSPRSQVRVATLGAIGALYLGAIALGPRFSLGAAGGGIDESIVSSACLGSGLAVAALPATALVWLLARGHALRPVRAGVLIGAAAGVWALAALEFCPSTLIAHNLVSHLGVALALASVGGVIGLIRFRRRPQPLSQSPRRG